MSWRMVEVGSGWRGDQRPFTTIDHCRKQMELWQWGGGEGWRGGPRGERIKRGNSQDTTTDWMGKEGKTL